MAPPLIPIAIGSGEVDSSAAKKTEGLKAQTYEVVIKHKMKEYENKR